jgi:Phospholipase_D-nuclease N-terminal
VTSGDFFWSMFWVCLVFVPLLCVWMFSIFDVFTRQMSGWAKAAWLVAIVFLPFVGTLLYLILRPGKPASSYYAYGYAPRPVYAPEPAMLSAPVEQLRMLSTLHDDGKLTDAEFESAKARIVGPTTGPASASNPAAAA